jgi:hypothetical protein
VHSDQSARLRQQKLNLFSFLFFLFFCSFSEHAQALAFMAHLCPLKHSGRSCTSEWQSRHTSHSSSPKGSLHVGHLAEMVNAAKGDSASMSTCSVIGCNGKVRAFSFFFAVLCLMRSSLIFSRSRFSFKRMSALRSFSSSHFCGRSAHLPLTAMAALDLIPPGWSGTS